MSAVAPHRSLPVGVAALMVAVAALVAAPAQTAFAQAAGEVAEAVEFRGYYVEDGLGLSIDTMERLVDDHPDLGFVALGDSPDEGADLFADEVLALIDDPDTVVVLTEDDAGMVSADLSDEAVDEALDRAFATSGDTYETDFREVAEAVASSGATGGGSTGGFPIWIVVVLVLAGGLWWMLRGNEKRTEAVVARRVESARREIRQQMTVIADDILEMSDRIDGDRHPEALAHYRSASATFGEAEGRLAGAATELDLEELADELDEARWQMAAAEAIIEGRQIPPHPEQARPEPCFFDPTHGAGVEEARLETPAGDRTVMVCRADADRLRNGDQPEPRSIDVGGRSVPAPQAPRTHGGQGLDWLDAFSIIVGGMSAGRGYRWGRSRSGGFGGGLGGLGGLGGGFGGPMRTGRRPGRSVGRSRPASRSRGRGRRSR